MPHKIKMSALMYAPEVAFGPKNQPEARSNLFHACPSPTDFRIFLRPRKKPDSTFSWYNYFSEHGSNNWECEPVLDIIAALDYRAVDACEPL